MCYNFAVIELSRSRILNHVENVTENFSIITSLGSEYLTLCNGELQPLMLIMYVEY